MSAPAAAAAEDVRAHDHHGLLSPEGEARLQATACACCGSTNRRLRPGGYAYRWLRGGRLGYAVKVCPNCPAVVRGEQP